MLHLCQAKKMVSDGKTEEVFQAFVSDFQRSESKGYDPVYLNYIARQINDKWKRSNPGEANLGRMEAYLKDYLKDYL